MKPGDLVAYKSKPGVPLNRVGVITGWEDVEFDEFYFVKWTSPQAQDRNWYRAIELRVINESR